MGCDIHTFTEKKPSSPATGTNKQVWRNTDLFEMNGYYDPNDPDEGDEFSVIEICGGRDYDLFSVLANVRNAGSEYICEPKGIPDDCCAYIRKQKERWDGDGHSHSWFTLHELKEYREKMRKQGIMTKYSGYMDSEDAELVDKGEMPNMWWGSGNAPGRVYREWEHFQDTLAPMIKELEARKLHVFKYDQRLRDASENSVDVPQEIDKEIRIVFWFDN